MKRFLLSLLILVGLSPAFSQKVYFIYLQSENDQPFFVNLNEKIYSSSAMGHLVLSRLRDSSYNFTIGFPQNKYNEQKFSIDIKGKDRGYLLKNFGEKGWGLFDLQTLSVTMAEPVKKESSRVTTVPEENISVFTALLATAANDPSLKERPVIVRKKEDAGIGIQQAVVKETVKEPVEDKKVQQPETVKKETVKVPADDKNVQQPVTVKKDTVKTEPVATRPVQKEPVREQLVIDIIAPGIVKTPTDPETVKQSEEPAVEYKRSTVTKRSESSTSAGFGLIFIDEQHDGKKDTIQILIPHPRTRAAAREQAKEERRFLDISAGDTAKQPEKMVQANDDRANDPNKAGCNDVATDNDFLKLQKKMMNERKEDDMIDEAKKVFKSKCFSSTQLKTLSLLFSNDNGKYKFFDAAYEYVSDMENFPSLVSELKDEYYVNRFKAMLRKT